MIEDVLKAMSAADAPPPRDRAFEIAVMVRLERYRFHRAVMRNAVVTVAVMIVLALVMPQMAPLADMFGKISVPGGLVPPGTDDRLVLGIVLTLASLPLPWRMLRG